jgi:hypothetical protein
MDFKVHMYFKALKGKDDKLTFDLFTSVKLIN